MVLAALGGAITKDNADTINAKYIVELANGPVTDEASSILAKKGIEIVPDILANAGGVVVSYYEWLQNCKNEQWSHDKVLSMLDTTMLKATDEVVHYANETSTTLKQAAIDVAVRRLLDE